MTASSSAASSSSDSVAVSEIEDDSELVELLVQTKNRLENTDALRVRSHLLRPEDYVSGCPNSGHFGIVDTDAAQFCTHSGWLIVCAVMVVACGYALNVGKE